MKIRVDFQSAIPLYEQIAHQVLELIEEGELRPGDQLPTSRALAVELGINFNTVARAYRMLDQSSIISTQQGRGTFILDKKSKQRKLEGKEENIEDLTRYYLRKALYLGFKPEEIKEYFEKYYQERENR
jgi:DNA-binding transcriptional regulator YhcF (GntR family)